ncbi:MAG: hypothetical protein IKE65_07395, partial [Clostridia bacterium]|nr:hypothetical protein [Clostridia bacterium]
VKKVWFLRCSFIRLSDKIFHPYTKYARKILSLIRIKLLSKNCNALKIGRFFVRTKKKLALRLTPNDDFF